MSTHLKNDMTTKKAWGDPFAKVEHYFLRCSSTYRKNLKFLVIIQSVTADGSLRSPTGGVEVLYPTPHIHEQMTAYNMATSTTTLSTTR